MHAIGTGLVGQTKRAFNQPALRPAPWKAKKDGSPATLKSREATLWRSIRVVKAEAKRVRIGSDRPYAAIHQLGGKSRPMPARPYFPFYASGQLTPGGAKLVGQVIETVLKL
jgi:phage gpG-like protein